MDLINQGQKLTLYFQKGNKMVEMSCWIENVLDDRIEIVPPQYFMRYIQYLQVGMELFARVFTRMGTIDFNTIIISSPMEDAFQIELDYNSVRLTDGGNLLAANAIEKLEIISRKGHLSTKTLEISSRGIKFSTDEKFLVDDMLDCKLILPNNYGIIEFKATVTEINPQYENEYAATFMTITEENLQNLLYYIDIYLIAEDTV